MAITLVGTGQAGATNNGNDTTLTFDVVPQPGDVIIVFGGGFNRTATGYPGPASGQGYTQIYHSEAALPFIDCSYKVVGSPSDTTVVCKGTGNAADASAYCAYVLRGYASSGSPVPFIERGPIVVGPTTSTNPDPGSITVTRSNWVIVFALSTVNDGTPGTISNYTNHIQGNATDTNPATAAGATREITTTGTENPGAWSSWGSGTWIALTLGIQLAPVIASASLTEADDTKTLTATVAIAGTSSKTEDADTILATATVANSGITGALAVTEESDSLLATTDTGDEVEDEEAEFVERFLTHDGRPVFRLGITTLGLASDGEPIFGLPVLDLRLMLGVPEAGDTVSATGTVSGAGGGISAELSVTEASDSITATATLAIAAQSSITEAADSLNATAATAITATFVITEGGDSLSATGANAVSATLSKTEASDTISSAATNAIAATASITEASDSVTSTGALRITATASITEAGDTIAAAGDTSAETVAELIATEANDSVSATGTLKISAQASIAEAADSSTAAASFPLTAVLSKTEDADSITATAELQQDRVAALSVVEAGDILVSTAAIASVAQLTKIEEDDDITAVANTGGTNRGTITLSDRRRGSITISDRQQRP